MNEKSLLSISKLYKTFEKPLGLGDHLLNKFGRQRLPERVCAVDQVNFTMFPGEALGLVGESGCGKSTIARMILKLLTPSSGEISFREKAIEKSSSRELLKIQMVFQDPYSSLNPRKRLAAQISEAIRVHSIVAPTDVDDYMNKTFEQCGIDLGLTKRYPHQLSGGQCQRFGIARALAMQPDLVICDEPVAALDVSIQAQIINLFMDLRTKKRLAYLFISHDLSVVRHLCDRVAVMYLGRIVEEGPVEKVFGNPLHPYTQALKSSSPVISSSKYDFEPIRGEIPSPLSPPSGCHFHPRCPLADEKCRKQRPEKLMVEDGLAVACHKVT